MRLARVVLVLAALSLFPATGRELRAQTASAPSRYAVVIVLDGARPQYFRPSTMPNLRWLLERGVEYTQAFVGQELANTPPSHATIGTGLFPRDHGVEGFEWKNPATGTAFRPADLPEVQAGELEAVLTANHVPSIAAQVKKANPRDTVLTASGHKCYAADAMGTASADYILCAEIYHDRWVAQAVGRHRPPPGAINNPRWDVPIPSPRSGFAPAVEQWNLTTENSWVVRYALWAFRRIHYPRVMMLNLPETDVTGHFVHGNANVEARLMQSFDRDLGTIIQTYRQAGILDRTTFIVTADHGMSAVRERVPFSALDDAIHLAGATKIYEEADTAAAIGIRELNKARAVALNVVRLDGHAVDASFYKVRARGQWMYRVAYMRPDLPYRVRQAYEMLVATDASASGAEVMIDYGPHITTGDRIANGYHWWGGHLGPQWDDQHIPLIIAGAGVRHGVTSSYPARLVDIAPTVERILGLAPTRTDGLVLQDALTTRDPALAGRQSREGRVLIPLVRALAARSLDT